MMMTTSALAGIYCNSKKQQLQKLILKFKVESAIQGSTQVMQKDQLK